MDNKIKPVSIDGFCDLRFLSGLRFSPSGQSACMVVTGIDRKEDCYKSDLWVLRDGKFRRLTSSGRVSGFQYLDEDTILFPGRKDPAEANDPSSTYYRISLSGGESEEAYRFPIPVTEVMPLPGGDMIVAGRTVPGFEDLYTGKKPVIEAYKKYLKDEADYEVITEVPWWHNGGTYTRGSYNSLYYYTARTGKLRRLTDKDVNVWDVEVTPDKNSVYFLSSPVRPRRRIHGENSLFRLDISGGAITCIAADRGDFALAGIVTGEDHAMVLASDNKYGLNTDVDFYRLDYDTDELTLAARYGQMIGTSVGTDIRYGGGYSCRFSGEDFYFISTRWDGAYLYKLSGGSITQVTSEPGSVDCFDVCGSRLLMVALRDMKAQEVYDIRGRQISHFNSKALRGRYVAEPEILNIERDGYEVHGFVLRPADYDPEKKYPVILDIHGGPKTVYGPVFFHEMQYWAGRGYYVIFCNPTGSDGRGEFMDIRGRYGTVDYEDIMAFTDAALEAYPSMDADNLFETGGSYGGFMTNWIIGHTDRFRACASQRSISNWLSFYGISDIGVDFTVDQNLADPWGSPEKLWEHSPLRYADRAVTPTLFIHALEDYRCPVDQGYQMYSALVANGVESRIVLFRGENHELSRSGKPSHRIRRLREITDWFDSHLQRL